MTTEHHIFCPCIVAKASAESCICHELRQVYFDREAEDFMRDHDKEVLEAAVLRVHIASGEPYGYAYPLEFTEVYDAIRGEFVNSYPPAAVRGHI